MKLWSFRSLDTLFFRDGTPLHQGEGGGAQPRSQFPPSMQTLQGAIRTTLACKQGWSLASPNSWPTEELGTPEDLGDLKLCGPYLQFQDEMLFSAPNVLYGKKKGDLWNLTRLVPGNPVDSDLGKGLRFPQLQTTIDGEYLQVWLTRRGMEAVLQNKLPDSNEIYTSSDLWTEERRVGIARYQETRNIKEKHFYALDHVRLTNDLRICVGVSGVPDDWHPSEQVGVSLGGEGRFAEVSVSNWTPENSLPAMPMLEPDKNGKIRYTVSLLTPGCYTELSSDNPDVRNRVILNGPPGIIGTCVSASIGKLLSIGGWDLKNRKPRTMKPLIPAGSTWFLEANAEDKEQIEHLHGASSGEMTAYGMGQMVIGIWREEKKEEL